MKHMKDLKHFQEHLQRLYNKAKQHKMELPEGVLAYRFWTVLIFPAITNSQSHSSRTELPKYEGSAQKDF